MYRALSIAFLGLALIISGMVTANAAGPGGFKIGYVDFEEVLLDTPAGKRASQAFEKELKQRQSELDKKQKDLQQKAVDLDKQRSVLKPEVFKAKQQELEKTYVELQQTYVKLERELTEQRTKLIRDILKQAEPVVKKIAADEGFDMILDRSTVVWARPEYDLTGKIKQRLK